MKKFKFFDHTADIGMNAFGRTRKELFSNAAEGMFSMITEMEAVRTEKKKEIFVREEGYDMLLREWLSELLTIYNIKNIVFREFLVKRISEKFVEAEARGEEIDLRRHRIKTEIKNVTYHNLSVKRKNGIYEASIIFDV